MELMISLSISLKRISGGTVTELCRRLFLCLQIPLITAWARSLRKVLGDDTALSIVQESRSFQEENSNVGREILVSDSFQMISLNAQERKRWSLVSMWLEHKTHRDETCIPHETNLALVGSRLSVAVHIVKVFLCVDPLNQTEEDHHFFSCLGRIASHVLLEEPYKC